VGTTATAWLVSFKLTEIGPVFIVLGALLSALPVRASVIGKAVFYFGLIFFALDLISATLKPLQEQPGFKEWLALAQAPWRGVLTGLIFTAVIQSSSVTTGVGILLVQQDILPPQAAIPIVLGANVGSTSTALMASFGMNPVARATAIANFLFNAAGVLIYFPFLGPFARDDGSSRRSRHRGCRGTSDIQSHNWNYVSADTGLGGAAPSKMAIGRFPIACKAGGLIAVTWSAGHVPADWSPNFAIMTTQRDSMDRILCQ
jgi:Na+/Pi-cotransporter